MSASARSIGWEFSDGLLRDPAPDTELLADKKEDGPREDLMLRRDLLQAAGASVAALAAPRIGRAERATPCDGVFIPPRARGADASQ
jgi:hypothetical protein